MTLIEMNTKNIFLGGKGGRCLWLGTLSPSYPDCLEIWLYKPKITKTFQ